MVGTTLEKGKEAFWRRPHLGRATNEVKIWAVYILGCP